MLSLGHIFNKLTGKWQKPMRKCHISSNYYFGCEKYWNIVGNGLRKVLDSQGKHKNQLHLKQDYGYLKITPVTLMLQKIHTNDHKNIKVLNISNILNNGNLPITTIYCAATFAESPSISLKSNTRKNKGKRISCYRFKNMNPKLN